MLRIIEIVFILHKKEGYFHYSVIVFVFRTVWSFWTDAFFKKKILARLLGNTCFYSIRNIQLYFRRTQTDQSINNCLTDKKSILNMYLCTCIWIFWDFVFYLDCCDSVDTHNPGGRVWVAWYIVLSCSQLIQNFCL